MVVLTPEEYLNAELTSPVNHEFLGGLTYAMAGASNVHNLIATNTFVGESLSGVDAVLPLPEIGAELPLAEVYDAVDFLLGGATP